MGLSAKALCALIELKEELGITVSTEDSRLERLINTVATEIAGHCGVPSFHHESARVDDLRGYGMPALFTPKRPLLSIGSIIYDPQDANDTVDSGYYLIDNADQGRIYRAGGWVWTVAYGEYMTAFPLPGTEESLYRVTYAGGYRTRNQIRGTLNGKLDGAAEVAVVINETIPTDTPTTGEIRVRLDDDTWLDLDYTSWASKTFTIAATAFDITEAADGNVVDVTENLTLPYDLEDAALMLAAMRYRWAPRGIGIASEKLDSWSASYADNKIIASGGIPPIITSKLGPYVRPVFA